MILSTNHAGAPRPHREHTQRKSLGKLAFAIFFCRAECGTNLRTIGEDVLHLCLGKASVLKYFVLYRWCNSLNRRGGTRRNCAVPKTVRRCGVRHSHEVFSRSTTDSWLFHYLSAILYTCIMFLASCFILPGALHHTLTLIPRSADE